MANSESVVLDGVLSRISPYNEGKPSVPGKLFIDLDDGSVADIAFFNESTTGAGGKIHASPPKLGEQWAKVNPDRDQGRRIRVVCNASLDPQTGQPKFFPAINGNPQFKIGNGGSVNFLDAAPTINDAIANAEPYAPTPAAAPAAPVPAPAAPAPAARVKPIDGAKWGNNLNNSTIVNVQVAPERQAEVWGKILRDAAWLYAITAEDIAAFLEEKEPEAEGEESLDALTI